MRKDDDKVVFERADIFDQCGAAVPEHELMAWFHEYLENTTEPVDVIGYMLCPADILKQCDPVAYREEYLSWLDSKVRDYELFDSFADAKEYALDHGYAEDGDFI